jgi:hypothetical protein
MSCKTKLKAVPVNAMKTLRWIERKQGERSALRTDRFTAGREKPLEAIAQKAGWAPETVWTF